MTRTRQHFEVKGQVLHSCIYPLSLCCDTPTNEDCAELQKSRGTLRQSRNRWLPTYRVNMARHRNVRKFDFEDGEDIFVWHTICWNTSYFPDYEYDDMYGRLFEDEPAVSPNTAGFSTHHTKHEKSDWPWYMVDKCTRIRPVLFWSVCNLTVYRHQPTCSLRGSVVVIIQDMYCV